MVRDQECNKTFECIQQQYQSNKENDPFAPAQGRGYMHHADHYYAQRFLKREREWKPVGCPEEMRDHHSQSREQSHERWHIHHGEERLQGLYDHHVTPKRAPCGQPLGEGDPERVPQEFHDAYHSAREEQSDTVPDSRSDSEEEFNDIVTYDTETSRYTMVADQDHCIAHDH